MQNNSKTVYIPLDKIYLSDVNVRKVEPTSIESMASSIAAVGLIQNLVVVKKPCDEGEYSAAVGKRRLLGLLHLAGRGEIAPDYAVRCIVCNEDEATSVSLAENVQREAMHPADEWDAFAKLVSEKWTVDRIADAFGVTPLVVERRMMLSKAAPKLIELFRANEISTEQVIALCGTDDHEVQLSTWENTPEYSRHPHNLRRLVRSGKVPDSDPRVKFIGGVAKYEEAGGKVTRDLFSDTGEGSFIGDVALLDRLVLDRLEERAEAVQNEGWAWVEASVSFDQQELMRFGRVEAQRGEIPDGLQAKAQALAARLEALDQEENNIYNNGTDELTEAESERMDEIETERSEIYDQQEAIEETRLSYPAECMAYAGAYLSLRNGELVIERGLVKPEDRKEANKAMKAVQQSVGGGRETQSAGRKAGELSDALKRSLLGLRNVAAQSEVASHPKAAKVLMACWLIDSTRSLYGSDVPLEVSTGRYGIVSTLHTLGDDVVAQLDAFKAKQAECFAKLPKKDADLWDALYAMDDAELDAIVAFGVAGFVSLKEGHAGFTGKLLAAMGFDMAAHFTPTASNYLGRVSKPLMVKALKDVDQAKDADVLLSMKKGELASEAEKRMAGSGWVPMMIRTPKPKTLAKGKGKAPTKRTTKAKASTKAKTSAKGKGKAPAKRATKAKASTKAA